MADNTRTILIVLGVAVLLVAGYLLYDSMQTPQVQPTQQAPQQVIKAPAPAAPSASTGMVTVTVRNSNEVKQ